MLEQQGSSGTPGAHDKSGAATQGRVGLLMATGETMKIIVAGSRDFNNYRLLEAKLDFFIPTDRQVQIVSGTAQGADQLGEKYAEKRSLSVQRFPADWGKYGKRAGYIRNDQMARYASHAVIFWDGSSKGTASMIELCKDYNLPYRVVLAD